MCCGCESVWVGEGELNAVGGDIISDDAVLGHATHCEATLGEGRARERVSVCVYVCGSVIGRHGVART